MSFLISMLLPFAVSLVIAAGASLVWWQALRAPWLFAVVGVLGLLGIHRVLQGVVEVLRLFGGGGYFLEIQGVTQGAVELAQQGLIRESAVVSVFIVVFGLPLLLWLKSTLRAD